MRKRLRRRKVFVTSGLLAIMLVVLLGPSVIGEFDNRTAMLPDEIVTVAMRLRHDEMLIVKYPDDWSTSYDQAKWIDFGWESHIRDLMATYGTESVNVWGLTLEEPLYVVYADLRSEKILVTQIDEKCVPCYGGALDVPNEYEMSARRLVYNLWRFLAKKMDPLDVRTGLIKAEIVLTIIWIIAMCLTVAFVGSVLIHVITLYVWQDYIVYRDEPKEKLES